MSKKKPRIGRKAKSSQRKLRLEKKAAKARNESGASISSVPKLEVMDFSEQATQVIDESGASISIVPKVEVMDFSEQEKQVIDETRTSISSVPQVEVMNISKQEKQVIDETGTSISSVLQVEVMNISKQETQVIDKLGASTSSVPQLEVINISETETPIVNDDEWFWSLPGFGIENDQLSAGETTSPLLDSSPNEADQYAVILDSVYYYSNNENVDDIVDGLKQFFLENLYSALRNWELPPNWSVVKTASDVAIAQLASSETRSLVVQKSISVDSDRNIRVCIHKSLLNVNETWMKVVPKLDISQSIKKAVEIISKIFVSICCSKVCCGNFEEDYFAYYEEKLCNKPENNSYVELLDFQEIAGDGSNYSRTLRARNCHFILKTYIRCKECSKLRRSIKLNEYRKRIATPRESFESASSSTNFSVLSSEEKTQRFKSVRSALKMEKQKIIRLNKKIDSLIAKATSEKEQINLTPSQEMLWKEQIKAAKLQRKVGMRWHPQIIRWCLSIYGKSPSAYNALRETGFIILPSKRTLFGYSQSLRMKNVEKVKEVSS